jgi:ERCC4-type nuclease
VQETPEGGGTARAALRPSEIPAIVIDTREQLAYGFDGFFTERRKLDTGDYSLVGYENRVAVERKSKADAYGCVGAGRDRFERCLRRLGEIERPAVVIEADLADFAVPPPRTRITAAQAVGSYVSWSCTYRIPIFFCGTRAYSERVTLRWLMAFLKHVAGGGA